MRTSFKAGLVSAAVAAAVAIPVGTAYAGTWVFGGLYQNYGSCENAGNGQVRSGNALAFDCEPDTGSTYDLYLFKN
jgi:hypothetical protein